MTEIVLLHHICGLTPGVHALADAFRAAGHTVHTPDLFDGATFSTVEQGAEYARGVGFEALRTRGLAAVGEHPGAGVVAGISFGTMAALAAVATLPDVRTGLLLEGFADPEHFGGLPAGARLQVHGMDADPFFAGEGDLDAAREVAAVRPEVEVFTYPGDRHLFVDASLASSDPEATALVVQRCLEMLERP